MNFGGVAVGGMAATANISPPRCPAWDHLRHPLDIARNAFSRGEPEFGVELADELECIVTCTTRPPSRR